MTIRDDILEKLRAVVDPAVHIIPWQDATDVIDRRTIMLKQGRLSPLEGSPRGGIRIDYVLTFIAPATDPAIAEAELDAWVPEVLADLNTLNWLAWLEGRKVLFGSSNLAYDVDAFTITTPKNDKE